MRVAFLQTHTTRPDSIEIEQRTSPVDWWRLVRPAQELQKNTDWQVDIVTDIGCIDPHCYSKEKVESTTRFYAELFDKHDVVVSGYSISPYFFAYMRTMSDRYNTKHIMDYDDDLLNPTPYNVVTQQFAEQNETIAKMLTLQPYMTMTNAYLKKQYKKINKAGGLMEVIGNAIDLELYEYQGKAETDKVRIVYQGGSTHIGDLYDANFISALSFVLGKYRNKVDMQILGHAPDDAFESLPNVHRVSGTSDLYEWVETWKKHSPTWDIGIAPLENLPFNWSKSPIKFYEYTAAKIPTVASGVGPYRRIKDGVDGFLCNSTEHWIETLEKLIKSKKLRDKVAEAAYKRVSEEYTIQKNWEQWRDFIVKVKEHRR